MCFSSDFDIAVFNGITAPNPPAVAWEIPRRQGVGGEEPHGALPVAASKLHPALRKGSEGESGQPRSRGAGLKTITFPLVCLLGMEEKGILFPKCATAACFPVSRSTVKITCAFKRLKQSITLYFSSFSLMVLFLVMLLAATFY